MAELYIKYRGDKPIKYAYGEEWVAMALYMDDYGFKTEEEAIADFHKRMEGK